MVNFFRNILTGIYNVIRWLPTIWNDRDWDDYYILYMLKTKLQHMENFFRSDNAWSARAKEDADNIRYAINLIDKIQNHDYTGEALKPFRERNPEYKFELKTEPCEDNPKLYRVITDDTPEQKELLSQCYNQSEKNEDNDYKELFRYLGEHIREWWD